MSSLQKEMFKKHMLPQVVEDEDEEGDMIAPLMSEGSSSSSSSQTARLKTKYAPLDWREYFESCEDVNIQGTADTFRVYRIQGSDSTTPVFVMHHGAGHSGLSFALTARHIKEMTKGQCSVVSIDARGHGDTHTSDETDFSLNRLSDDLVNVVQELYGDEKRDLILVGHSMGGSVVVDVAQRKRLVNIQGVAVLDVVEGSAMDALASMTKILSTRPQTFPSIEHAIQWSVKSETVRNVTSARVSVPSLVLENGEGKYNWRTDLTKTTPFWTEWFTDLSNKFLSSSAAKLLILAGTDRLDKPLMIAQMQGKFQVHIIPEAGHFLQEDAPQKTAQCLVDFWTRNKRLVLPPKVQIVNEKINKA
ncbi:hypothetical protein VTP01DRAFT_3733 [Rhizomucor pusillus]|uniref:uncharacterized protein n=1 Tax=Rhizomucor pusillus TaxID=4840 RepID=UPI003742B21E